MDATHQYAKRAIENDCMQLDRNQYSCNLNKPKCDCSKLLSDGQRTGVLIQYYTSRINREYFAQIKRLKSHVKLLVGEILMKLHFYV
jgi:hypothetical protein